MEEAAKEPEPEHPPVKRKKVGSEMELYKEYTDERKKTKLAWQRIRAPGKGDSSKTVEKAKKEHKAVEEEAKEDSNNRAIERELENKRTKELEERKREEKFKRREMEVERQERELEKKREDIRKLENERELPYLFAYEPSDFCNKLN